MNIEITIEDKLYTIFLYNIQYWNQRFFALGQSTDGELFKRFISTKGFDKLLMESPNGPSFNFRKEHFNPYLCNKEKDLWHESVQLDHQGDSFTTTDIGSSEYSGHYRQVAELGPYKDDVYFETRPFTKPDFDLKLYQEDDLYFVQHQSLNKDRAPKLISLTDIVLYDKVNIIHGVTDEGEDLFDLESVVKIIDTDISFPEKNSLFVLSKAINLNYIARFQKFGCLEFYKNTTLEYLQNDCGNSYIQSVILHKKLKRKHALKYLYEYFQQTNQLISLRRKTSPPSLSGPKEFKQNEFNIHFDIFDTSTFKIIFYSDIFTIERKANLSELVPAQPELSINGKYNFVSSAIEFDDFVSTKQLLQTVRQVISVNASIKLAKLINTWLYPCMGYSPRISKIHTSKKANSNPLSDNLTFYHLPTIGSDDDLYETTTYVNAFEFFATFGIHIPQVRNILNMNWFNSGVYSLLQTTFAIYHVSRDYRRPLFNWDNDVDLKNCMLAVSDSKRLIGLLESAGDKKNSYWYNNGNTMLTAFPNRLLQPQSLVPQED